MSLSPFSSQGNPNDGPNDEILLDKVEKCGQNLELNTNGKSYKTRQEEFMEVSSHIHADVEDHNKTAPKRLGRDVSILWMDYFADRRGVQSCNYNSSPIAFGE